MTLIDALARLPKPDPNEKVELSAVHLAELIGITEDHSLSDELAKVRAAAWLILAAQAPATFRSYRAQRDLWNSWGETR